MRYVYQRLGFQYFTETLFEDAGNNLFNGQLDPRVLISYFPQLRGTLFTDEDHVDVFAGIAEKMPRESSVDDISTCRAFRVFSISICIFPSMAINHTFSLFPFHSTHPCSFNNHGPDAVIFNLVRNYSPHMSPNTQSAPPTAELRKILQERALQMLETFLKKERRRRMALDLDRAEMEQELNEPPPSSKGKERERPKPVRAVSVYRYPLPLFPASN